jgi:hypothetical protein
VLELHRFFLRIASPGNSPELGCHQHWRESSPPCIFLYPVLITSVVLLLQLNLYIKAKYLAQFQGCLMDKAKL